MRHLNIINTILATYATVYAYPQGSPLCVTDFEQIVSGMGQAEGSFANMDIVLATTGVNYSGGEHFSFQMRGAKLPTTFSGILLYAEAGDKHVGTWDIAPSFKALDDLCKKYGGPSTTLSHATSDDRPCSTIFKWTAPHDHVGPIQIKGIAVFGDPAKWVFINPLTIEGPGSVGNGSSASSKSEDKTDDNGHSKGVSSTDGSNSGSIREIHSYMAFFLTGLLSLLIFLNIL